MAKKLKDAVGSTSPLKLGADFDRLDNELQNTTARKATAQSEYSAGKKKLDDFQVNKKAYADACKIRKMSVEEQGDYLRSLTGLLDHWGIPAQSDMFDAADQHPATGAEWAGSGAPFDDPDFAEVDDAPFDVDQPGESGEEVIPAAAAEDEQQEEAAAAEPELASDWRDAVIAIEDIPHDAGTCFNRGAAARREGLGQDANPHNPDEDLPRARSWLDGWRHADVNVREEEAERAAAEAAALAADVATAEADVAAADADNVRPFPTPAAEGDLQDDDAEDEPAEKPKRSRRAVASAVPPSRFEPGATFVV